MKVEGKTCSKCGEWKEFDNFNKDKNRKDGFKSSCKECIKHYYQENKERMKEQRKQRYHENKERENKRNKQYYQENKEQLKQYYQENKERMKQYYQENKERIIEQRKHYYQENAEQLKEYQKEYRQENAERLKEYQKEYRQENAEQLKEYQKEYRQENAERLKEHIKQYRQENAERYKESYKKYSQTEKFKKNRYKIMLKRRSYKHKVNFIPHERKAILDRDNWKCCNCGIKVHDDRDRPYTPDKANIDHVIPISKGGDSEPNNLQTLCRTCNLSKSDKIELQLTLF